MPFSDAVMVNPPVRLKRGETYPFVAMADVEPAVRSVYSPQEREFRGSGARFESGDTLMARITPCLENGKIGRYNSPMSSRVAHGSTEFIVIRGRSGVTDNEFAYYLAQSNGVRDYAISQMSGTSGRQRVPTQSLEHLNVRVPSLAQQYAIARTLGMLDDKIDLNRRLNETLEAMARTIFKDWFVDFGPTRAKAEGRTPYLAPELWDLFPDALDDEGKPAGWRREKIGKHVIANKGLSYKGAGLTSDGSGVPLHNLNSILEGGGYKNDGLKFYSGDYKPRHIIRTGDLVVANTEQGFDHLLIGYSALVPSWVGSEGLFSHHLFNVQPKTDSPLSRVWLHFALSASWFGEAIRRFSNGTTVNMLPADAFEIPEIIVPPSELVQGFGDFVGQILEKQESSVGEMRNLAATRDLLLPKLMSGEIRLRDIEKVA